MWVSIIGALISACPAAASWYFGKQEQLHKRLSVQPAIVISFDYDDTGAGFHMYNKGLGPAVIGSFQVFADNKIQRTWEEAVKVIGLSGNFHWHKRVPYPSTIWTNAETDNVLGFKGTCF